MPTVGVSFAESAVADLDAIRHWYAEQGVAGVGERLVAEIVMRVETLRHHPDMGRMVPEFGQPVLRELVHPPFRIVYRRDDPRRVRVVLIWRGERRLTLPDPPTR